MASTLDDEDGRRRVNEGQGNKHELYVEQSPSTKFHERAVANMSKMFFPSQQWYFVEVLRC